MKTRIRIGIAALFAASALGAQDPPARAADPALKETLVARDQHYEEARRSAIARMRRGIDIGIGDDGIRWTRDELHER